MKIDGGALTQMKGLVAGAGADKRGKKRKINVHQARRKPAQQARAQDARVPGKHNMVGFQFLDGRQTLG